MTSAPEVTTLDFDDSEPELPVVPMNSSAAILENSGASQKDSQNSKVPDVGVPANSVSVAAPEPSTSAGRRSRRGSRSQEAGRPEKTEEELKKERRRKQRQKKKKELLKKKSSDVADVDVDNNDSGEKKKRKHKKKESRKNSEIDSGAPPSRKSMSKTTSKPSVPESGPSAANAVVAVNVEAKTAGSRTTSNAAQISHDTLASTPFLATSKQPKLAQVSIAQPQQTVPMAQPQQAFSIAQPQQPSTAQPQQAVSVAVPPVQALAVPIIQATPASPTSPADGTPTINFMDTLSRDEALAAQIAHDEAMARKAVTAAPSLEPLGFGMPPRRKSHNPEFYKPPDQVAQDINARTRSNTTSNAENRLSVVMNKGNTIKHSASNRSITAYNMQFVEVVDRKKNQAAPVNLKTEASLQPNLKNGEIVATASLKEDAGLNSSYASRHHMGASLHRRISTKVKSIGSVRSLDGRSTEDIKQEFSRRRRLKIENERANLNWWGLKMYNAKKWLRNYAKNHKDRNRLWAGSLKFIEGRFGTGIASYFMLARWIWTLNLFLMIVWLSFVMLINIIAGMVDYVPLNDNSGFTNVTYGRSIEWPGIAATIGGIISGDVPWDQTFFFYRSYRPWMLNFTYRMDLAYTCVILAFLALSLVGIIRGMRGEFIRKSGFSTTIATDDVYPFCSVAFTAWNHAVEDLSSQRNQMFAISTAYKTLITQYELKQKKSTLSKRDVFILFCKRFVGNVLAIGILVGAGFLIWDASRGCDTAVNNFLFSFRSVFSKGAVVDHCGLNTAKPLTTAPFAPYIVSFFNAVLPFLFFYIAKFESYADPQWETRATLARSYLIKIASIYILLISLYKSAINSSKETGCWEHEIAKRFYTLQWLDLILSCVISIVSAVGIKTIWGVYEFDITSNILELVYRQAIVWIGSVYAPIMSVFSIIIGFFMFFVKKWITVRFSAPPRRIYNSYSQVSFFLLFLLLTLILTAGPTLFAMVAVPPSQTCGPFRKFPNYNITFEGGSGDGAYTVITKSIQQINDVTAKDVLQLAGSILVLGPLIAFMAIWIYGLLAIANKRNERIRDLEKEVQEEREDKKNLIRYYKVQM
ncbi:hypothetical protein BKA69DRAFT_919046 [Paraphysoderma sedebokerense]|nr:hypothetical protein BKA69DRAFT_919046 [Paraphysoderma sedebokerense]